VYILFVDASFVSWIACLGVRQEFPSCRKDLSLSLTVCFRKYYHRQQEIDQNYPNGAAAAAAAADTFPFSGCEVEPVVVHDEADDPTTKIFHPRCSVAPAIIIIIIITAQTCGGYFLEL
jgi:hypothetical protein